MRPGLILDKSKRGHTQMTYTQITAENLIDFPMGSKVRFNYGPMYGSADAMLVDFQGSPWGVQLIAETETGERHFISGFSTVGIGCYLIETPPK